MTSTESDIVSRIDLTLAATVEPTHYFGQPVSVVVLIRDAWTPAAMVSVRGPEAFVLWDATRGEWVGLDTIHPA